MIFYDNDGLHFLRNLFRMKGSVFPKALKFSCPISALTCLLVWAIYDLGMLQHFDDPDSVMSNNAMWGGFSFLVGFLVVFRTSQAYMRFWESACHTHKMGAEFFDACSSLLAFCVYSNAPKNEILAFQNLLLRLFSMLHASALGALEDFKCGEEADGVEGVCVNLSQLQVFDFELLDAEALDVDTLKHLLMSDQRVELVFQWIQQLVVLNMKNGVLSVPPPILTRSFNELANGMVHFHESLKIAHVPFPFPYAQTCDCLLCLHWLMVPFVVSQWVRKPWWALIFCFIQVFTLWTLNLIAVELENPFGTDANDIDTKTMQCKFNNSLRCLFEVQGSPPPSLGCLATKSDETQVDLAWKLMDEINLSSFASILKSVRRKDPAFFDLQSLPSRYSHRRVGGRITAGGTVRSSIKSGIRFSEFDAVDDTQISIHSSCGEAPPPRRIMHSSSSKSASSEQALANPPTPPVVNQSTSTGSSYSSVARSRYQDGLYRGSSPRRVRSYDLRSEPSSSQLPNQDFPLNSAQLAAQYASVDDLVDNSLHSGRLATNVDDGVDAAGVNESVRASPPHESNHHRGRREDQDGHRLGAALQWLFSGVQNGQTFNGSPTNSETETSHKETAVV